MFSNRFPCSAALQSLSEVDRPAMQGLYGTFGKDMRCAVRFMDKFQDRPNFLEVHSRNGSCERLHRCERYENPTGRKWTQQLEALKRLELRPRPNTTFCVSTGLEDGWTNGRYKRIRKGFTRFNFACVVRNPVSHRVKYRNPGDLLEMHGPDSYRADIVSTDGNSLVPNGTKPHAGDITEKEASEFLRRNPTAIAKFLYKCDWQGTCDGWVVPPLRVFKFTSSDILLLRRLFQRLL